MADNFLEQRMEDLRAGRPSDKVAYKHKRQGPRLAGLCVVIVGGLSPEGEGLVRDFRRKGATVDFLDCDYAAGNRLAQQTGACFRLVDFTAPDSLSAALTAILASRPAIDLLLNLTPHPLPTSLPAFRLDSLG